MTWFLLSFLTALSVASQDAWVKKHFSRLSVYEMSAYPLFYALPLFILSLFFIPTPPLNSIFYWSFIISLPLNAVSYLLYMLAIRVSPLSLTVPFLAFTPTFIIATGYLFLDEMPNVAGIGGILLTCIGAYVININTRKWSPLAPFAAVVRETGSWMMLIVAFLFSFAAVIGKVAMVHSSPLFFTMTFFCVFSMMMLIFLLAAKKSVCKPSVNTAQRGLLPGCCSFCMFFSTAFPSCWWRPHT
jgi:drug/metabolite transporter (DMT)-like permease